MVPVSIFISMVQKKDQTIVTVIKLQLEMLKLPQKDLANK